MVRNEKLTAIIPARGGSKGIPGKNLYKINGETLVERAINLAIKSCRVEKVLVSTDDPEIYSIAEKKGASSTNYRPSELATDDALTIDVVIHELIEANINEGYVLLLQPTSPLRTIEDFINLCDRFEKSEDSVAIVSVVKHESPHPDKIMKLENGYLTSYLGKNPSVPRQNLPIVYSLNGAFYLTHYSVITEKRTFLPEKTIIYEMPPERSVNIDGKLDILLIEAILRNGKKNII